ncbi:RDD family protein [uncultured Enterovirga sp.]|uniref:RDD family protein n=1 Tax=uncultured Enterovirga sp. TaxID=2026352 RepID=UPI0035CA5C58
MQYDAPYASTYARSTLIGPRTEGVLGRRVLAYVVDLFVITLLAALFGTLLAVASVVTFGLTLPLFAILWPATAILYSAVSVGGSGTATFGMRIMGLSALDASTGGRVGFLVAGVHALLFYVGIGTLLLLILDVVIGFARSDRRLGHDLLAGIIVVLR